MTDKPNLTKKIEVCSYFAAHQMISHSSKFGRHICGIYRSDYERRFAECLKHQKVNFTFERYAFKLKNENGIELHYIPDFHINGTTLFIEITKGSDKKRRHKILMFQEQYPKLTLMLLHFKDVRKYVNCEFDIDFDSYKLIEEGA